MTSRIWLYKGITGCYCDDVTAHGKKSVEKVIMEGSIKFYISENTLLILSLVQDMGL